jgi:branched-chain amino acid transport system substrate-binding protein
MVSRRRLLIGFGVTGAAALLAACSNAAAPTAAPTAAPAKPTEAAKPTSAPAATPPAAATTAPAATKPAAAATTAPAATKPAAATTTSAAPAATAPAQAATGETIYFGVSGPFTGDNAEYGRDWKKGFGLALDEINGAGGIKGRKLDLVYEDTQADPKQAVAVAQKFVNDPKILAELGDFASPASMAASPIYQRGKLVQFGFTNSHPDFTKGGDYMFSTAVTVDQDAAYQAQVAFQKLGGKRQAVLWRNTDWGKTTSQVYLSTSKQLGADVAYVDSYLETEKDFKSLLAKVRDAKPDVLSLIAYYNDAALIVQQARQAGVDAKVIANGSSYSPQFVKLAGDAANGTVMPTVFFPDSPVPGMKEFVQKSKQAYGDDPDQYVARAYDALKILAWAATTVQVKDGKFVPFQ